METTTSRAERERRHGFEIAPTRVLRRLARQKSPKRSRARAHHHHTRFTKKKIARAHRLQLLLSHITSQHITSSHSSRHRSLRSRPRRAVPSRSIRPPVYARPRPTAFFASRASSRPSASISRRAPPFRHRITHSATSTTHRIPQHIIVRCFRRNHRPVFGRSSPRFCRLFTLLIAFST